MCSEPYVVRHYSSVALLSFQDNNFGVLTTQIMAGRGGRGAILEALLAQQQRPGAQNDRVTDEDEVRSMVFQWSKVELGKEYIWFLGDLGDTGSYFCVVVSGILVHIAVSSTKLPIL